MNTLEERQRAHFNSIAGRYHAARLGDNHLKLKQLMWSAFLGDKSELKRPGLSVLDAMCGYADAYAVLSEHLTSGIDYSGFDYSDEVVAHVRRENPRLRIAHGDVITFAPDRAYDLVVVIGGLHHVHHAATEAVRRLTAAIKPGGSFLSLEPTHGNPLTAAVRKAIYRRNSLFDAATEQDFAVSELFGIFQGAGLELTDAMFPGLLSYILYYNPDAFPGLNLGNANTVERLFRIERPLTRSPVGRFLSFATLSLWKKPL